MCFNVGEKQERVARFIKTLRKDLIQVTHAAGYTHPTQFNMDDVVVNTGDLAQKKTLEYIYGYKRYINLSEKESMLL